MLDPVAETRTVVAQAPMLGAGKPVAIVPFVHLGREDAAKVGAVPLTPISSPTPPHPRGRRHPRVDRSARHAPPRRRAPQVIADHRAAAGSAFVGIRMILNFHPTDASLTWPQVDRGDYLTGGVPAFDKNFSLLAANGLSFDTHVNWFQLEEAAAFLAKHPDTTVVVDHLGCPKLGQGEAEDAARTAVWRKGLTALAALGHVHLKVSGLVYIRDNWIHDAEARGVIK